MLWITAFVLTNIFLDLEPGSAVERVVSEGMVKGWLGAQPAILGIVAADFIWCFLAISSLFTTMVTVPLLLYGAKWFGLACLLGLLARSLHRAVVGRGVHEVQPPPAPTVWRSFVGAFELQTARLTELIFFVAVLSVFTGSRVGWADRLVQFGFFAVALEWPVFTLYAFAASKAGRGMARRGAKTVGESVAALALLFATGMVAPPSLSLSSSRNG
ncbi:MAG: LysE family transporter [Phyllobacteriaceae bacterium]|nr:LysE family transporter [Phyllobacteriaceae bacterium]